MGLNGLFVNGAEFVLAYTAKRANPVFGEFFEWGTWLNAVVGVTYCGIVNITANFTYIIHNLYSFSY